MERISEEINHIIVSHVVFTINLFGLKIEVKDSIISMWILILLLYLLVRYLVKNLTEIPDGKQNIAETFVEFINNFVKDNVGHHHYEMIAPYIGTILLFLGLSNMAAIFNVIPNWHQMYELTHIDLFHRLPVISIFPPTKDINVTLAMAVVSVGMVLVKTFQIKKFKGTMRSFIEPVPLMLPFHILDYIVRPLSLTLRMFGNVMAAFIMMELVYMAFPLIFPGFLSLYFDLFDGILQAFIFTFLTSLYMAEALE